MRPIDKKLLKEEVHFVRLSEINLANVKVDDTVVRNDVVPIQLVKDIQTAAARANVRVTITSAKSGRKNELTTSGHISRHIRRLAVDISIIDGIDSHNATNALDGNREFKRKGDAFVKQLIALGYAWNETETENLPKSVFWQTNKGGNHYNHIHVSNTEHVFSALGNTDAENKSKSNNTTMNEAEIISLYAKMLEKQFPVPNNFIEFKSVFDTPEKRKVFYDKSHDILKKRGIDLGDKYDDFEKKYGTSTSTPSVEAQDLLNKIQSWANSQTAQNLSAGASSLASGASSLAGGTLDLIGGLGNFLGKLGSEAGDWMRALDAQNMTNDIVIKKGDKGDKVEDIQRYLISQGFNMPNSTNSPDGTFGPETEKMVKEFQKKNNLKPTGVVNDATMRLLKKGGKVSIKYIDPNKI